MDILIDRINVAEEDTGAPDTTIRLGYAAELERKDNRLELVGLHIRLLNELSVEELDELVDKSVILVSTEEEKVYPPNAKTYRVTGYRASIDQFCLFLGQ